MTKRFLLSAVFAAVALFAAPRANAQATFEFGPRAGFELDDIESFLIGGDLRISTAALPFQVQGTFDYYFADDFDANRFSFNALYEFGTGRNALFVPYFGPGLSITRFSPDGGDMESEAGLNLVGGAEFDAARLGSSVVRPFVQADAVLLGGEPQPVQITAGILFAL